MISEIEIKEEISSVNDKIAKARREQETLENNINYLLGYNDALTKVLDGCFRGVQAPSEEPVQDTLPNIKAFHMSDPKHFVD